VCFHRRVAVSQALSVILSIATTARGKSDFVQSLSRKWTCSSKPLAGVCYDAASTEIRTPQI
jgi:hypothetical protein